MFGLATRLRRLAYKAIWARPFDGTTDRGMVTFTFDDFPSTALDPGGVILESFGWQATYYAASALLGAETDVGRVATAEELARCHSRGHEIGNHSFSHLDCARVPARQFAADCRRGQKALTDYGARNFAYPYGSVTVSAKVLVGKHCDSCRGIRPGTNAGNSDLNDLRANAVYSHRGLDLVLEQVEHNISTRGWLIFYTHDVRERPSQFGVTPSDLNRLASCVRQSGMSVVTVREALKKLGVN